MEKEVFLVWGALSVRNRAPEKRGEALAHYMGLGKKLPPGGRNADNRNNWIFKGWERGRQLLH